jgi:hypothetical protein
VAEEHEGFLPPEPPGPEPELAPAPPPPPPPTPVPTYAPPNAGFPTGAPAPPPTQGQQTWPPPPPPGQPYVWTPTAPAQPDNGPAVAGFTLTMISAGLWLLSAGISSVVSITCAIFGIVYGRRGKAKVESGETQKHKSLAQVAFVGGIVMTVLASLSTIFWILIAVFYATDEGFRHDFDDQLDDSQSVSAGLRVALAGTRLVLHLLT